MKQMCRVSSLVLLSAVLAVPAAMAQTTYVVKYFDGPFSNVPLHQDGYQAAPADAVKLLNNTDREVDFSITPPVTVALHNKLGSGILAMTADGHFNIAVGGGTYGQTAPYCVAVNGGLAHLVDKSNMSYTAQDQPMTGNELDVRFSNPIYLKKQDKYLCL